MKRNIIYILISLCTVAAAGIFIFGQANNISDARFVSLIVDAQKQDIKLYWKDENGERFKSILNLKNCLGKNNKKLLFAMNAGMYKQDFSPKGLFIEDQKIITALDTTTNSGNFYLKPNGVFYITVENLPFICSTNNFMNKKQIKYATQSGPMLVIDGKIHSAFKKGSTNLNIRNGVGIMQDNKIIFAMSKKEINLFDFAEYFKNLGCKNDLYPDELVSKTYLLYLLYQTWVQTDLLITKLHPHSRRPSIC
jgi:uncharacterized protein YigE (DUF2233 family)